MQHAERVHSRSQLLDKVWGDHVYIEERTVDVHVKRLRESLGAAASMVETVRGAGYRLTAQITADRILSAQASHASRARIISRHALPNCYVFDSVLYGGCLRCGLFGLQHAWAGAWLGALLWLVLDAWRARRLLRVLRTMWPACLARIGRMG
jgi:hypothetical protein